MKSGDCGIAEFVLELPSDLQQVEAAVSYLVGRCREFAFEGPRLDINFRVGVTEAIANAVLYGNRADPEKVVRIEVCLNERQVEVWVIDEGTGFDPSVVPDPTTPENIHEPGGRGLFLIRKLMDDMEYNDRGNAVRMTLVRQISPRRRPAANG
jgi:serine/threonine-protein kinase RsbW